MYCQVGSMASPNEYNWLLCSTSHGVTILGGSTWFNYGGKTAKFKSVNIKSVSYTHLDVYKRQPLLCIDFQYFKSH